MRHAILIFCLVAAIKGEAPLSPYFLPRPAANAPSLVYQSSAQSQHPVPAPQPQPHHHHHHNQPQFAPQPQPYHYPQPQPQYIPAPQPQSFPAPQPQVFPAPQPQHFPSPQPQSFPAPAPQPQHHHHHHHDSGYNYQPPTVIPNLQPQPRPHAAPAPAPPPAPQPIRFSAPAAPAPAPLPISYYQPSVQQLPLQQYHQPQFNSQPQFNPQPQPQQHSQPLTQFQPQQTIHSAPLQIPSTSYGVPQTLIHQSNNPHPQSAPQPITNSFLPAPQQQTLQGYQYQQPQPFQSQISSLPLQVNQASSGNSGSSLALTSYQADSNQHHGSSHQNFDYSTNDALDSTVVGRVQNILKDNEHASARNSGYVSLVSGVSLESARPSVEISSFVQNSPLELNSSGGNSASSSNIQSGSNSANSVAVVKSPSPSYGLPQVIDN